MAPTSTTSTIGSAPTGTPLDAQPTGFDGDEFSNNLFSDLAPLLTLFGEQVTKQFLSMSMGWADHILLGCGPLGVITAVVSAIRVGGERRFKALVGRARESRLTAERELLSSTSDDICELWNGREIVREIGQSRTKELVLFKDDEGLHTGHIHDAVQRRWLTPDYECTQKVANFDASYVARASPNLTLNIGVVVTSFEMWSFAVIGLFLQSFALVLPAVSTYWWQWQKGSSPIALYAYPCFVIGTLAVIAGMALCSRVVDLATDEFTFSPSGGPGAVRRVFRIQPACTIGDQHYPASLILNKTENCSIRASRLNTGDWKSVRKWSSIATCLAITGFVFQFVGLRGLHWSATIVQLGVTLTLTAVRAWVRRSLTTNPKSYELSENVDQIAKQVGLQCLTNELQNMNPLEIEPQVWEIPTGFYGYWQDLSAFKTADILKEDPRIKICKLLQEPGTQPHTLELATKLHSALRQVLNMWAGVQDSPLPAPRTNIHLDDLAWMLPIASGSKRQYEHRLVLRVRSSDFRADLHTIIALWSQSISDRTPRQRREVYYLRSLGSWSRFSLPALKYMPQWLGERLVVSPVRVQGIDQSYPDPSEFSMRNVVEDSGFHIPHWPVFGYFSMAHVQATPNCDWECVHDMMAERPDGYVLLESMPTEESNPCLFFVSSQSLETQCALEIFGSFIEVLAQATDALPPVPGVDKPDEAALFGCEILSEVAMSLVREKLVDSIAEANAVVVPPFARRGLIPLRFDEEA